MNDIVLAVINDGNGSMCGLTYQHRCGIVRCQARPVAMMQFRNACRRYSQYSRLHFETPYVPHEKVNAAAQLVLEYYRQHVKEIDKCNEDARIEASIKKDKENQNGR